MPDIILLNQEDIHKLASGEVVSCPGSDGEVLIMSKMRWLTEATVRYKQNLEAHGTEFTDEHQAFPEALGGIKKGDH